jgi:hypothetical protein
MVQRAGMLGVKVQTHLEALHTSSRLTSYFRRKHQPMATDVTAEQVIKLLHEAGINCVLMGAHGLGSYRFMPRSTQDVDVLVPKRGLRKAVRVLHEAFPELTVKDTPVVTRFIDPATEMPVLDVMKPTQRVFRMVFRYSVKVGDTHRIPDLEMALVSKFAAITSPIRDRLRKMQDATDFAEIAVRNKDAIDLDKLQRLAELVYAGGSEEIKGLIDNIAAGRPLRI